MSTGGILVLVEHRDNQVDSVSLQLLSKGRQLADKLGVQLNAVILGSDIGVIGDSLAGRGVDTVFLADHPELAPYNPEIFANVLTDILQTVNPILLLLGYTFLGMEIGPCVATRLGIRLVSNCTDIELSPEGLPILTRPIYSEMVQVKVKGSFPVIASVQMGALSTDVLSTGHSARVPIDVEAGRYPPLRTKIVDVIRAIAGEVDLTKADVIVAVGRGIEKAANLKLAKELAQGLGGVIAASRPVIDMGWLPPEYLVGLSGKTVSSKVYIACGISGAAQHIAGMSGSQMIIAINKDSNAPIFQVAHYGLLGDLFEILPALIDEAAVL